MIIKVIDLALGFLIFMQRLTALLGCLTWDYDYLNEKKGFLHIPQTPIILLFLCYLG